MTAVRMLWGPGTVGVVSSSGSPLNAVTMDSSAEVAAWTFCVPKDGTITDVGYYVGTRTGTPPAYNVGIVTLDSSGRPTTTAYGGSAITAHTATSTGWKWVTLDTSATANAGVFAAARVYAGGTAPSGSNYIAVTVEPLATSGITMYYKYGGWNAYATGAGPLAVKYSDGTVWGFALSSNSPYLQIRSNTTPDEVGCKFTVPASMTVFGMRFWATAAYWGSSATFDAVLYDGSDNVLASTSVSDKDNVDDQAIVNVYWDAVSLTAATTYRVVVKPTVASGGDIYINKWSFESTAALAAVPCGDAWQWTQRVDAGAWTDTNTAVAPMALWVSDITFSAASAGGAYAYIG